MQTQKFLAMMVLLLFPVPFLSAQGTAGAGCDLYVNIPPCPLNPQEKPGYFLLLNQSFSDPAAYWNISRPFDDKGCDYNFMRNSENVTFPCNKTPSGGRNRISARQVKGSLESTCYACLWNTDTSLLGCPYSMGEIKTMTVDTANHTFKSYYFYGSGYIEAKVRQLYCSPGQGSAMWLWCVLDSDDPSIVHPNILDDNEIDVFETQPADSGSFNLGYHWRDAGLQKMENYYRVHTSPKAVTGWTVYGLSWNNDSIIWYLNNTRVCGMKMSGKPSGCTSGSPSSYQPPAGPFCIRFNSGPNTVGEHGQVIPGTMPARMEIEYVRMYKPAGEKAAPIKFFSGTVNQICFSENSFDSTHTVLSANYYPDAAYSWSSTAFGIAPYEVPGHQPQHHSGKVKIWVKPGVQPGQSYPLILTTTIFSHTETDTAWILVTGSIPPMPSDEFSASLISGPLCVYEISHPVSSPETAAAEFFDEASGSWKAAEIRKTGNLRSAFFGHYSPQARVNILYREKNACGVSDARNSLLIIPSPPTGTCGW